MYIKTKHFGATWHNFNPLIATWPVNTPLNIVLGAKPFVSYTRFFFQFFVTLISISVFPFSLLPFHLLSSSSIKPSLFLINTFHTMAFKTSTRRAPITL
ncbi:hypothetical protein HanIR_Chr09g0421741 [Helianthus annuus]|nr:hypothetical protein HanIR_Chr09g0421741 [Helianthus annuus]